MRVVTGGVKEQFVLPALGHMHAAKFFGVLSLTAYVETTGIWVYFWPPADFFHRISTGLVTFSLYPICKLHIVLTIEVFRCPT